jgi:hypothetical protein
MRDITLAIIDTVNPNLASKILDYNYNLFNVKDAKIFTDTSRLSDNTHEAIHVDIKNTKEYSNFLINKLNNYISTNFVIILQIDGFIINPQLWRDSFLEWDYIGAPWPHHPSFPNRVGNVGFSLRSKKFLEITSQLINTNDQNEDHFLCRTNYNLLSNNGIKFADLKTASKFSLEHNIPEYHQDYSNVFGIHGRTIHSGILNQITSKL